MSVFDRRLELSARGPFLRCAYFRGMFESGMKETTQSELVLDDISHEVFLAVLQYLYVDEVEVR